MKNPRRSLHPNVWVLSITSFLTDVSSEMLFNLLPLFLVNVLGVRTAVVGLIEGIAEATSSLLKIVSGSLSDYYRKRKWLSVLGYSLSTIAKPFLYFAASWRWVLGVRFTDRVGKGIRTGPRDALLSSSTPPEHRGFAFGLHRAGDTAGAFIGLGIAALIIWLSQSKSVELIRETFQRIVLISIIPSVLAVLILAVAAKELKITEQGAAEPSLKLQNLNPTFFRFLVVITLFTLGNSSDAFIILRAQERGLSLLQIMGMLLSFNAVYTLLSSPAGLLSDRIGRRRVVLLGWCIYTMVYLGLALAQTGMFIWLLFCLYGAYYAFSEGTMRAYVADLVDEPQRGTAFGLFHAAVGIAALPASLIAGTLWQGVGLWQGFGAPAPFFFGAALASLAGFLFIFWVSRYEREQNW